jgi:hypothetical protein
MIFVSSVAAATGDLAITRVAARPSDRPSSLAAPDGNSPKPPPRAAETWLPRLREEGEFAAIAAFDEWLQSRKQ